MDFGVFDNPRPSIDGVAAAHIAREHYGIECDGAESLQGERDRSFKITAASGQYVLKIGNVADHPAALEAQGEAIEWALSSDPRLPIAEVIRTTTGEIAGRHGGHALQLTRFIDGSAPPEMTTPPALRRSVGAVAARLSQALRGFDHPVLHRAFPWTLGRLPELAPLLDHVSEQRRRPIAEALASFEQRVVPALKRLPHQATHGDINPDNIVVDHGDPEQVVGLFDFGDMSWGPRVIEVAIAATYQSFGADPIVATGQVLSAFHLIDPLQTAEIDLVLDLVAGRCAQSLLLSARHLATSSENTAYATGDTEFMWETLTRLERVQEAEAASRIRASCGLLDRGNPSLEAAMTLRKRRLAPSLRLSYDEPVHLRSGEGVWLYDSDGTRLLDAYNNVPHVGHSHPQVLLALAEQSRRLTTNTRYLVDGVAEYADRLTDLMPNPLSVVWFVNSGSEANDLAYRIARVLTGNRGVITTENAYHGTTAATSNMSPEEHDVMRMEDWAAQVGGPDLLADPDAANRLLSELDTARDRLMDKGELPAMAIFDTVFSSDGIFEVPSEFLSAAREWSRGVGALLVADEVQGGFGRVGLPFWGFALDSAVPDIVTLGKPMGNGYPMAAVVTTREIATEFSSRSHFFSTFAGSPVSAAAGNAVLDAIEDEGLAERAQAVGAYAKDEIRALSLPGVIDVRGPGLFLGVELSDPALANKTVNGMRRRGVLIGSTGTRGEVLKIRPPLVCSYRHIDIVIEALQQSLEEGGATN
jgi:4-aminobutyrate aminotransferase-like enzyme/Ser/Thr protein kinase RdoA (MazF antagonist)